MDALDALLRKRYSQVRQIERMISLRQDRSNCASAGLQASDFIGRLRANRVADYALMLRARPADEYDIACNDPAVWANPVFQKVVGAYNRVREEIISEAGRPKVQIDFAQTDVYAVLRKFVTRTMTQGEYDALDIQSQDELASRLSCDARATYASINSR
jgi:hypothetical protein